MLGTDGDPWEWVLITFTWIEPKDKDSKKITNRKKRMEGIKDSGRLWGAVR